MGKKIATVLGWVFLVLGIIGFISNPIIGSSDGAIFRADTNHNLVHLLTGAILLWAAYKAEAKVMMALKVFGVVYILIGLLGLLLSGDTGSLLGLVEVNGAVNVLHLVLGAVLLYGAKRGGRSPMPAGESMGQEM